MNDGTEDRENGSRVPSKLSAAKRGDVRALAELIDSHKAPLYRVCLSMLASHEDAEDAVQETFLRGLRSITSFREQAALRTWLTRIAVNVCNDALARRKRIAAVSFESVIPAGASQSPETEALARFGIADALKILPVRQRTVLLLKETEELSAAEIASVMRWTQRRVYYELALAHKALAAWRQRIREEGWE